MAAKTWTGTWWEHGGGGTAWDAMAYDPDLNLLYVGTGNGAPWNRDVRSPGGGDNLFLASILAINKERWRITTTGTYGGTMATAGNLVFQGSGDKFNAYDATTGEKLWETTLSQAFGTPVSYELDGVQYVSILAGSGVRGRLYTFALDAKAPMPELPVVGGAGKGKGPGAAKQ